VVNFRADRFTIEGAFPDSHNSTQGHKGVCHYLSREISHEKTSGQLTEQPSGRGRKLKRRTRTEDSPTSGGEVTTRYNLLVGTGSFRAAA
jgi:hypothetical protein